MQEAPKKKYDTNPLDKKVAERAEAEMTPEELAENEGPTRPMGPAQASGDLDGRDTGANQPYGTSPQIGATAAQTPYQPYQSPSAHGAYVAPHAPAPNPYQTWGAPPTGPMAPHYAHSQYYPSHAANCAMPLGLKPNFAAMLSYLPYAGIVGSILLSRQPASSNEFVRFHAKQSLYAHIAFWAITIAFDIARAASPGAVSIILMLPQMAFHFASIVGLVYMMVKTYKWQTIKIPVLGDQVE
jgi:uncharacterized membrane protein